MVPFRPFVNVQTTDVVAWLLMLKSTRLFAVLVEMFAWFGESVVKHEIEVTDHPVTGRVSLIRNRPFPFAVPGVQVPDPPSVIVRVDGVSALPVARAADSGVPAATAREREGLSGLPAGSVCFEDRDRAGLRVRERAVGVLRAVDTNVELGGVARVEARSPSRRCTSGPTGSNPRASRRAGTTSGRSASPRGWSCSRHRSRTRRTRPAPHPSSWWGASYRCSCTTTT